jgi:hypothetical protein
LGRKDGISDVVAAQLAVPFDTLYAAPPHASRTATIPALLFRPVRDSYALSGLARTVGADLRGPVRTIPDARANVGITKLRPVLTQHFERTEREEPARCDAKHRTSYGGHVQGLEVDGYVAATIFERPRSRVSALVVWRVGDDVVDWRQRGENEPTVPIDDAPRCSTSNHISDGRHDAFSRKLV